MERDKLLGYIFDFMPILHKKLFKGVHGMSVSRQQIKLLFLIKKNNGKPMKFYVEKLMISKPNLTKVVNKLIREGYIIREHDASDRRNINLYITKEGEGLLAFHMKEMKRNMLNRLEVLEDEDVLRLNRCFEEMVSILSKLD